MLLPEGACSTFLYLGVCVTNSCTGNSTNPPQNLDSAKKHPLTKAPFRQAGSEKSWNLNHFAMREHFSPTLPRFSGNYPQERPQTSLKQPQPFRVMSSAENADTKTRNISALLFSKKGSTPTPWARGPRDQIQKWALQTQKTL